MGREGLFPPWRNSPGDKKSPKVGVGGSILEARWEENQECNDLVWRLSLSSSPVFERCPFPQMWMVVCLSRAAVVQHSTQVTEHRPSQESKTKGGDTVPGSDGPQPTLVFWGFPLSI